MTGIEFSKDMPPEQIRALFDQMADEGVIEYVITTIPLGEEWVVGAGGQLTKFDTPQAVAFLIGYQHTLHWLMGQIKNGGMKVVPA